jgi:DNA-binding beta-propeller fold protein YncE
VGNGTGGVCNAFDGENYDLIKSVPLGVDADNVRYNPRTQRIYVVHADTELSVIDAKDYSLRSPIALPRSLGAFQLESGRPRMYVNAKDAGQVVVIDTDRDVEVGRFPVAPAGVNAALAIDEPNHRLFVGCRKNPSLVVMDSDSGKIVASVPIPGDVDDVSYDAKRKQVYASCGDGAIAVIRQNSADRYEAIGTVPTPKGARTSVFNPEDGRLYLAVPRRAERPEQQNPEVWVYRASP